MYDDEQDVYMIALLLVMKCNVGRGNGSVNSRTKDWTVNELFNFVN